MPARTQETDLAYEQKGRQLLRRIERELGHVPNGPLEIVSWFESLAPTLSASTIRLYKAALKTVVQSAEFSVRHSSLEIVMALDDLAAISSGQGLKRPTRTSAQKAKSISEKDHDLVVTAIRASSSGYAQDLLKFIAATDLTALRPVEWPSVRWTENATEVDGASVSILICDNAKNTNGRAHGQRRTQIFADLPPNDSTAIAQWVKRAKELHDEGSYDTHRDRMQELLNDAARRTLSRRSKYPALSSWRHFAIARWKAELMPPGIDRELWIKGATFIAALCGHVSDATASSHYASGKSAIGKRPMPLPNSQEVEKVRPRLARFAKRMQALKEKKPSAEPRSRPSPKTPG